MKNKRIEHDVTIYERSNIFEFDNGIMMHYYPQRVVDILKEQGGGSGWQLFGIGDWSWI